MLVRHAQYILERRNCVVLPGFGALICATDVAHFDSGQPSLLLPPRRHMTFNNSIIKDDGSLAASYSRSLGISVDEAKYKVTQAINDLIQHIQLAGSAPFGKLGYFNATASGSVIFIPKENCGVNNTFSSLIPVDIDRLTTIGLQQQVETKESIQIDAHSHLKSASVNEQNQVPIANEINQRPISSWAKLRNKAAGIAASIAVVATLTLFLLNPIRMINEPQKASLAPIPTESISANNESVQESRPVRRLTIGRPSEQGYTTLTQDDIDERKEFRLASSINILSQRISDEDNFCVIVASFPTMSQARSYISTKGGNLAILEKDGKFRIYSATAPTYESANVLRKKCGIDDAWVCRR